MNRRPTIPRFGPNTCAGKPLCTSVSQAHIRSVSTARVPPDNTPWSSEQRRWDGQPNPSRLSTKTRGDRALALLIARASRNCWLRLARAKSVL